MTDDSSPRALHSTLVVYRAGVAGNAQRPNPRSGALRGTSRFLGAKGSNQRLFANDRGRSAALEPYSGDTTARQPWSGNEPPPLYYGLPSSTQADEVPIASTVVLHELETELSVLEGRVQRHASTDARFHPDPPLSASSVLHAPRHTTTSTEASGRTERSATSPARRWDDFGRDQRMLERFAPFADFLTRRYFRTVVTGIEHIPSEGPCLLVANHSGSLPIDGLVLKSALFEAHPARRHARWLTEDFVQNLPFVGTLLQRLGAVRASRENALALLQNGECVVAFPEGVKGYAKPIAQWYRVQRLGRGRIIGLCIEAGVPLLPCAIVGAEESTPSLQRLEAVERLLGMPYFPITPTFPWLGPLGLIPAPSRWYVDIGPPFLTGHDAARADDPLYVAGLTEKLRTTLQQRLDRLVAQRKNTWFG